MTEPREAADEDAFDVVDDPQDPEVDREVVEEDREVIEVLDQGGRDLDARLEQERGVLEDADEVELEEHGWTKRADEDLDAIRAAVDDMGDPPPRSPEEAVDQMADEPDEEAPDDADDEGEPEVPGPAPSGFPDDEELEPLTDEERAAVARHVEGDLLSASPTYRTPRGQVVEVTSQREGEVARDLLVVRGGRVEGLDEVARRVDALEPRRDRELPDEGQEEAEPEPTLDADEAAEDDEVEDPVDEDPGETGGLRGRMRGLFSRDDEDASSDEEAPEAADDDAAEDDGDDGGLRSRMRGLFSRDDEDA